MIITLDFLKAQQKVIEEFKPITTPKSIVMSVQYFYCIFCNVEYCEEDKPALSKEWALRVLGAHNVAGFCNSAQLVFDGIRAKYPRRDLWPGDWGSSSRGPWIDLIRKNSILPCKEPTVQELAEKYDCKWHVTVPAIVKIGGKDWRIQSRYVVNGILDMIGRNIPPFTFVNGQLYFNPNIVNGELAFQPQGSNVSSVSLEMASRTTNRLNEMLTVATATLDEAAMITNLVQTRTCPYCRNNRAICTQCGDRIYHEVLSRFNTDVLPAINGVLNNTTLFVMR